MTAARTAPLAFLLSVLAAIAFRGSVPDGDGRARAVWLVLGLAFVLVWFGLCAAANWGRARMGREKPTGERE